MTIAIPTYNRASRLATLLKVVEDQAAPGDELIVSDDASTDNTAEVVSSIPRFRFIRQTQRVGMVANWNACLSAATNDWICLIHDDDMLDNGGLDVLRRVTALLETPSIVLRQQIPLANDNSLRIRLADPGIWSVLNCPAGPSGAVIHRTIVEAGHLFNTRFEFSADLEFFPRLCTMYRLAILENPRVLEYRIHESNYQFNTWRDARFWPEIETLETGVVSLTKLPTREAQHILNKRLAAHLTYMLRHAWRLGDGMLAWSILSRVALSSSRSLSARAQILSRALVKQFLRR